MVLLLVLSAALLAAAPASAIIVKLKSGKFLSYQALAGKATPQPLLRRPHDAALSNLDYSGGPVMPSNVNYVIDWQPSNCVSSCAFEGTGAQNVINGVAQYFKDLQAGSQAGVTNNSDSISTQYNDSSGSTAAYNSQLAPGGSSTLNGAYLDSDPLPPNGCPEGTNCITDTQLQNELASFIASRGLPTDLTHEYFVITPPGVVSCFDAEGTSCSGNAIDDSAKAFCGYHSASSTSSQFLYADIPDLVGLDGCDPFVTTSPCDINVCNYNASFAEGIDSTVAHEHNESITDPQPNNAWTDWQQCSQGAPETCGGEIGDKCSDDEGLDPNFTFLNGGTFIVPRNELIGASRYFIQMEWSNQGHLCAGSVSQLGGLQAPPGARFTVKGDQLQANTDNFDASGSGSGLTYVWQFNDDPNNIQNTTVETTNPTFQHTFPAAGTYSVALTTMTATGRSMGTVTQIVAAGLTQAAFGVTSAVEGTPVGFTAASTIHDPSVGISSYSWNFGDRSPLGSGLTTSHRFTLGAHTVTLTVTDTLGRVSTVSQTVTVADRPPAVSFKAPSGRAGTKLSFTGRAGDDEGIARYLWHFGDGGTARGANVTHAFRRKGRFSVMLTAIDAAGKSASVSHAVVVSAPKPKPKRKRRR